LVNLDLSHNLIIGSKLKLNHLKNLVHLRIIDIQFNKECEKQLLYEKLKLDLPEKVELKMTIPWFEGMTLKEGAKVGNSAVDRDATLLRSQLEPLSTTAL